jgi:hypothetical protein
VEQERKSFDKEGFGEALRAVRARSLGPDPVAVRAALEEELADRGVEVRPAFIERTTRVLVATQGPSSSLRLTRELLKVGAEAVAELRDLVAVLRAKKELPEWLKPPPGKEVGIRTKVNHDGESVIVELAEVDLADGIQPFLAKAFDASFDPEWDDEGKSQCQVWVDARLPPPAGAGLAVILGAEPIGSLGEEDARTLDGDSGKAAKRKQPLILEATIERDAGSLGVSVLMP